MANCIDQNHAPEYSLFCGDSCEIIKSLPDNSIDLTVYSPPFATPGGGALYNYSSSARDFSNAKSYRDFFLQYEFLISHIARITKPGCYSAVHCMDVPATCNLGNFLTDFPGDIIREHCRCRNEKCQESPWVKDRGLCGHGWFDYVSRHVIWKEPLAVRNRTMAKGLTHQTVIEASNFADVAGGDYVLMLRKKGERDRPVTHETGLLDYYGAAQVPRDLWQFKGWTGDQKQNRFSHWIWRRYASCIWDDIRGCLGEYEHGDYAPVLAYEKARDADDESHVHPLQLDVIARCVELRTNPGERVYTPFAGVGSEVYQAVRMGRRAIGSELKETYYRQAVRNCATASDAHRAEQGVLIPHDEPPVPAIM
jgi:DNA modification methylase